MPKLFHETKFSVNVSKAIKEMLSVERGTQSSSFNPYEMTECPRRLLYRINGAYSNIKTLDIIREGLLIEKWRTYFSKVKKISYDKMVLVSDCYTRLSSKIHFIIEYEDKVSIVKIITVSADELDKIKETGAKRKDVIGVTLEMWMAEVSTGLIVYDVFGLDAFIIFEVKPLQAIITAVKNKCDRIIDHSMTGSQIQRPYKRKDKECFLCEFNDKCWEQ